MLVEIAEKLDRWAAARNASDRAGGMLGIKPCRIRLLDQMALFELGTKLPLVATNDVDVHADYEHAMQQEFARLLRTKGKLLDPLGNEVWMPKETRYRTLYRGELVRLDVADEESLLLSKALKAPRKNGPLITAYLAAGPTERFMHLARVYGLDLEQFL
ncbi:MAG: hypothetical protein ACHQ53_05700 [Polyangiales bacterium]